MLAARAKEVPVPAVQLPPALRLYCQEAPDSRLPTVMIGFDVMPSVLDEPVSSARDRESAPGACVSVVMAESLLDIVPRLPALSVFYSIC